MARRRNLAREPLVRAVRLVREEVPGFEAYPFSIPAIRALHEFELHLRLTFFAEGGSKNFKFGTRPSDSELHRHLCS